MHQVTKNNEASLQYEKFEGSFNLWAAQKEILRTAVVKDRSSRYKKAGHYKLSTYFDVCN